jgi:hypothetical protein
MQKPNYGSSAVRCFAAVAIGAALFALANRPRIWSAPLSPSELAIVGTWTYPDDGSGIFHAVTFNSDRTCVFDGQPSTYPSRWRIDSEKLVLHHRYQTVIGRAPIPLPAAVESLELPSFMATTEEFLRPVSLSPDGCNMTLGNITGIAAACTLTRTEATVPSIRGIESGRTMP